MKEAIDAILCLLGVFTPYFSFCEIIIRKTFTIILWKLNVIIMIFEIISWLKVLFPRVTSISPKTRSSTAYCLLSFCKPKIVIYLLHVVENRKTWHWLYIVGPNRSWVQYWRPHIFISLHNSICRKPVWAAGDENICSWAWMTHSILSPRLM